MQTTRGYDVVTTSPSRCGDGANPALSEALGRPADRGLVVIDAGVEAVAPAIRDYVDRATPGLRRLVDPQSGEQSKTLEQRPGDLQAAQRTRLGPP